MRNNWLQLAWHYNSAALDEFARHDSGSFEHQQAAERAVGIAGSTWPYWLAWPETHAHLKDVLGSRAAADAVCPSRCTCFDLHPMRFVFSDGAR